MVTILLYYLHVYFSATPKRDETYRCGPIPEGVPGEAAAGLRRPVSYPHALRLYERCLRRRSYGGRQPRFEHGPPRYLEGIISLLNIWRVLRAFRLYNAVQSLLGPGFYERCSYRVGFKVIEQL